MDISKNNSFVVLALIATAACLSHVTGYSYTGERSIRSSVLNSFAYDRMARPNATTTAYVGFNLLIINDIDIEQQRFVCTGFFTVLWNDDRLMWVPEVYDDTYSIHALENELWKPEVLILNAQEDVGLVSDDHLIYRVQHTGNVEWEPLMSFTVHCSIDVTYFPFDVQQCQLDLTSWGLPSSELKLEKLWGDVNFDAYQESGAWDIIDSSIEKDAIGENLNGTTEFFPQLIIKIIMQRKAGNYIITTIIPIIVSSFSMAVTILIPISGGERVTSGYLVLVVNGVLLTIFIQQIPDMATTTSVLGIYVCGTFAIDSCCVIASIILTRLYFKPKSEVIGPFHTKVIRMLEKITCYRIPPRFTHDDLLSIPTDDLRKVERSNSSVKPNTVSPEVDGFTEHVKIKEVNLPAFHPSLRIGMMKYKTKMLKKEGKIMKDQELSSENDGAFPDSGVNYQEAVVIWDRTLFALLIIIKALYNIILIGNLLSQTADSN